MISSLLTSITLGLPLSPLYNQAVFVFFWFPEHIIFSISRALILLFPLFETLFNHFIGKNFLMTNTLWQVRSRVLAFSPPAA